MVSYTVGIRQLEKPNLQASQNYFEKRTFLPPATKLGQGYIFTGVCDSVHRGGRAWLWEGMPGGGGMHGCGVCMVVGGMHGCGRACMVGGGMHGCRGCAWWQGGVCVWDTTRYGQ